MNPTALFTALLDKLGLGRIAKALVPPLVSLVTVGVQYGATSHLDTASLTAGAAGVASALLVYFIPNVPAAVADVPMAVAAQLVDTTFSPVSAGHPDPAPVVPAPAPAPAAPTEAPQA